MNVDVEARLTELGAGINIPWDRLFDLFFEWLESCNQSRMGRRRRNRGVKSWDVQRFFNRHERLAVIVVRRKLMGIVEEDTDVDEAAKDFVVLVSKMSRREIEDGMEQFGM